jgi:hypothetical protein
MQNSRLKTRRKEPLEKCGMYGRIILKVDPKTRVKKEDRFE